MPLYRIGRHVPQLGEGVWIAESASVIGDVNLGRNVSVWFGAVLRGDNDPILIGESSNIQDGAVLHSDRGVPVNVGRNVNVGHKAKLHGCVVGEGSLIGINAVLLNRSVIGKHCLIGAGSLIPEGKIIPDRSLVCGAPGRVIRQLTEEEVHRIKAGAAGYVENSALYHGHLSMV